MTEEEEKAIYRLKLHSDFAGLDNDTCIVNQKDVKTVLNLIQKQQAEIEILKRDFEIVDHECSRLEQEDIKKDKQIERYQNMLTTNDMLHVLECEKKDKQIDLMVKEMFFSNCRNVGMQNFKEWYQIKEYFKKKAEEN